MAEQYMHYRILLSCPSDVISAQSAIHEAVEFVNKEYANVKKVHFDVRHWSKDVLFNYGNPQQTINKSIVFDSDIVVAVFGIKLGTPTEKYASGTIEEIEEMIKRNKQVFVCFSEADINLQGNPDISVLQNLIKVQEFKKNYNGLYLTFKDNEELISKIENQLRLYIEKLAFQEADDTVCRVPFTFQELQGNKEWISTAKRVVFCARTGKIFLTAHYNHLKEMVHNGGSFTYITSENFNLMGDVDEHSVNQQFSLTFLRNLKKVNPSGMKCYSLKKPVNITILYIVNENDEELLEVKFNFQTKMKHRHPMFRLEKGNPYFDIFLDELKGIEATAELLE